jgi:hypothetical protein
MPNRPPPPALPRLLARLLVLLALPAMTLPGVDAPSAPSSNASGASDASLRPAETRSAYAGISGVFGGNQTVYVQGNLVTSNQISVALDPTGSYVVVTMNGQSVAYESAAVNNVTINGGPGGSDTITVGPLFLEQFLTINAYAGNNAIAIGTGSILASQTNITTYGDHNTLTATNGTKAAANPYGGPNNTYSPASAFTVSNLTTVPYAASSIPGVFANDDELIIVPLLQSGNSIAVSAGTGANKLSVTENGQTSQFGSIAISQIIYNSAFGGGDALTVNIPVSVDANIFGSGNTDSVTVAGASLLANVFASGNTFSIAAGSSSQISEEGSLGGLTESITGPNSVIAFAVAPMLPAPWSDGGAGSGTGTGTGGGVSQSASSPSSHHCGVGGGLGLIAALALALLARGRQERLGAR